MQNQATVKIRRYFRANFATVDEKMRVVDRRAGRKGSKELASVLNGLEIDGFEIALKNTTEHRCALVMKGENISKYVSDTHEKGDIVKEKMVCERLNFISIYPLLL